MTRIGALAALLAVGLCVQFSRAAGPALPVELTVREPAGVARPGWPITSGVPLPPGAVADAGELALRDAAGRAVPCQVEPVVRWQDGSIKWAHLSFQADLPAGGVLKYSLVKAAPAPVERAISVTEDADRIVLDTGAATVAISKTAGTIIESLSVDGKAVLRGRGLTLGGTVRPTGPTRDGIYVEAKRIRFPMPSFERREALLGAGAKSETWTWRIVDPRTLALVGSVTGEDGVLSTEDVAGGKVWTSNSGSISVRAGSWSYYANRPGLPTPEQIGADKAFFQFASDASQAGREFSSADGRLERVEIEQRGPLVACVYLEGTFTQGGEGAIVPVGVDATGKPYDDPSGDFLKYRVRVYAYAGKPYVRVVPSIVHMGPVDCPPQAYFRTIRMDLDAPGVAADTAVRLADAAGAVGRHARLAQRLGVTPMTEMRLARSPSYTVTMDGAERASGERAEGNCLLGQGGPLLGLGARRFWEYAPKAISVRPGRVALELWPADEQFATYALCNGRQRSHELLLTASPGAAAELAAFQAPRLIATAPPDWYAECRAFGLLAEEADYSAGYPDAQRAPLERYERLIKALIDRSLAIRAGGNPGSVPEQFVPGWNDYGDLPWAEGWSNLHYDWTMSMLLHFARTGRREFFDVADAMAWHRKDIAQNHTGQGGRTSVYSNWSNYLTYYEKDDHRSYGQGPKPSHSWNRGMAYWFLLTGDPMARLVATQSAEGLAGFYATLIDGSRKAGDPSAELRMYGWSIENFLGAYECTGEKKYLEWALGMFRSTFQDIFENRRIEDEKTERLAPLMYGYSFGPICRLHHYTDDPQVLATLRYLVDEALLKRFVTGGRDLPDATYLMLGVPYSWNRADWQTGSLKSFQPPWNLFWADPAAYLYMQTGERKYLDFARQAFKDAVYYYASSYGPRDPKALCSIAYHDGMFSASATKVHGWSTRFNHIYLYAEKQLARGATFPGVDAAGGTEAGDGRPATGGRPKD